MPSPRTRWRWRRRTVVATAAVAVLGAGGASAWALTTGTATAYRLATATRGPVQQALVTTGTLAAVHQTGADFQVAGVVGRVAVKVGDRVTAGQPLATLQRSSLRAAVSSAKSALTRAGAQLGSDQIAQLTGTAPSTTSAAAAGASTPKQLDAGDAKPVPSPTRSGGSGRSGAGSGSGSTVARDQVAVVAAQRTADADLAVAKTALRAEQSACHAEIDPAASPSPSPSATTGADGSAAASCTAAATTLLTAQQRVQADQVAVATAEATLSHDLAAAASVPTPATTSPTSSAGGRTTGRVPATNGGATVTAADLATDQASIDAARAQLATARADLRQATLTSPITGTVIAVGIARGDRVSGTSSSTGPAVQVRGTGQTKVTVQVTASQVRMLATGMAATVTPDGASSPIHGRVVTVGTIGSTSSTGDVSYPVTIHLPAAASVVPGADAAVSLIVATVANTLTVPTSAVHYRGAAAYVELSRGGTPSRRTVTVKAIGPARTQITSGLTAGEQVVLADLGQAVPSSSTTSTRPGGTFGPGVNVVRFGGPGGGAGGPVVSRSVGGGG